MKDLLSDANILNEWHPNNKPIENVSSRDASNFLWVCSLNHTWEAPIKRRIAEKSGCPTCSNKIILPRYNDLTTRYPDLAKEWHPTKNTLDIKTVNPGSATARAWWQCEKGHEWEALLRARTKQATKCPYCSGNRILPGYNDLGTLHPELAKEWHPTKNTLKPEDVGASYSKPVTWLCPEGHEWSTSVNMRTKKNVTCHTCKGTQPKKTTTESTPQPQPKQATAKTPRIPKTGSDLASLYPEVAKELHPTRNQGKEPQEIFPRSNQKLWWTCEKGHEYLSTVVGRTRGKGCGYCSGLLFKEEYNSLSIVSPELAREFSKKNSIQPEQVKAAGTQEYTWECNKGHEWDAPINDRLAGSRCPVCSNRKIGTGFNDLATLYPHIANELHTTKNGTLQASELVFSSGTVVWWVCDKGHEWQNSIYNRTIGHKNLYGGHNCPQCSIKTSRGEEELTHFVESLGVQVHKNNRSLLAGKEVDLYLPQHKIAIEYNGLYWHSEEQGKSKTYHQDKYLQLREQGIQLIQVWEDDWRFRNQIIKKLIQTRLGFNTTKPVYARTTSVTEIAPATAKTFMEENHIQGFGKATKHYALTSKELTPVAVMSVLINEEERHVQIIRYATSTKVNGGFTKLLKSVTHATNPLTITTFSDNSLSEGDLYKNSGFTSAQENQPDYSYIVGGQRTHKFNYRLERFKKDPTLEYDENLSETELARLNGLLRAWDSGKRKWELRILPNE